MYICICNPFTDNDVHNHLDDKPEKALVEDVYSACSEGEVMNCGSCACELKNMVDSHNNALTIKNLSDQIKQVS